MSPENKLAWIRENLRKRYFYKAVHAFGPSEPELASSTFRYRRWSFVRRLPRLVGDTEIFIMVLQINSELHGKKLSPINRL